MSVLRSIKELQRELTTFKGRGVRFGPTRPGRDHTPPPYAPARPSRRGGEGAPWGFGPSRASARTARGGAQERFGERKRAWEVRRCGRRDYWQRFALRRRWWGRRVPPRPPSTTPRCRATTAPPTTPRRSATPPSSTGNRGARTCPSRPTTPGHPRAGERAFAGPLRRLKRGQPGGLGPLSGRPCPPFRRDARAFSCRRPQVTTLLGESDRTSTRGHETHGRRQAAA